MSVEIELLLDKIVTDYDFNAMFTFKDSFTLALIEHNVRNIVLEIIAEFLGVDVDFHGRAFSGRKPYWPLQIELARQCLYEAFGAHLDDAVAWTGPTPFEYRKVRLMTYMWHGFLRKPGQRFRFLHDLIQKNVASAQQELQGFQGELLSQ